MRAWGGRKSERGGEERIEIAAVAGGRVVHGRRMVCCCLVSVRLFGVLQIFLTLQKGGEKEFYV